MAPIPDLRTLQTIARKQIPIRVWRNKLFKMGIFERGTSDEDLARGWVNHTIDDKNLNVKDAEISVAVLPNDVFSEAADPRWLGAFYALPSWHNGEVKTRHFFLVFPERIFREHTKLECFQIVMHELAHAEECFVHGTTEDYTERFEQYCDMLGAPLDGDGLRV